VLTGDFGADANSAGDLRARLRRVHRELEGVHRIDATVDDVRRIQLGPNDGDYRLMLNICDLLLSTLMPTQSVGTTRVRSWVEQGSLPLAKLFDDFVPAFRRRHLTGWEISAQVHWHWPSDAQRLPIMKPDVVLERRTGGTRIVLDTKFSNSALSGAYGGTPTFESQHLYQLYAYLRTQEDASDAHKSAHGLLLYPSTGRRLRERFVVQGHPVTIATVDLSDHWATIERELLSIVESSQHATAAG
jgi:5-methylcytosine-specific restriction enzyme subunit McrC